jgi:predicted phosphodiesterase
MLWGANVFPTRVAAVFGVEMVKIQDFGIIDGDVVLFGGPYSNLQSFEALSTWVEAHGYKVSNCICTGDIVAYGGNPLEVVERIRAQSIRSIAGNCERQLASGSEDCGCGFDEGSVCDLASKGWFPFAAVSTIAHQKYFAGLPDIATFSCHSKRYAVIHGGVKDVSRFIWPNSAEAVFREEIANVVAHVGPVDGIIAGHCGVPFERMIDNIHWINAGVIGMPPHDGRPQTRFAVLSQGGVTFQRLSYDVQGASDAMIRAGLTQGYEASVVSGIWPSEDILPRELRR